MIQQNKASPCGINLSCKVRYAICYNKVPDLVAEVIVDYLVKYLLGYLHLGRLALHNKDRFTGPVMNKNVGPSQHRIKAEGGFNPYQPGRIAEPAGKIVDKVLPDPLFRCECHILFPQGVIDEPVAGPLFYPQ